MASTAQKISNQTHNANKAFKAIGSEGKDIAEHNQFSTVSKPTVNPVQCRLQIGSFDDKYEKEADTVADHVVQKIHSNKEQSSSEKAVNTASNTVQTKKITPYHFSKSQHSIQNKENEQDEVVQAKWIGNSVNPEHEFRFSGETEPIIQKKTESTTQQNSAPTSVEQQISQSKGSGQKLDDETKTKMESGFGYDLSSVRIHTDSTAVQMNQQLGAKAFATGNDIYFNKAQYQPKSKNGQQLLAHEITHTIQQKGGIQKKEEDEISISATQDQVQGGWLRDKLASYASYIPGYSLLCVIIGYDPIRGQNVERNATNLLRGLFGLMGVIGTLLFNKLNELGIIERTFTYVEEQLSTLNLSLSRIKRTLDDAWDDMDFVRLDPFDYNLKVLKRHFSSLVDDVKRFVSNVAKEVINFVKEALLTQLRKFAASKHPAYELITQILGKDPITGEEVPRDLVVIIENILLLVGADKELAKMKELGTIQKTVEWLQLQWAILNLSWEEIQNLFSTAWNAFSLNDLKDPIGAFTRTVNIFVPFVTRVLTFAKNVAVKVFELIKEALLAYLKSFAQQTPGYTLFTVIIGKDPFTEVAVPPTADNLIKGFMEFVPGGREKYNNLKQSGAIAKALAWLQNEILLLNLTWAMIRQLFAQAWSLVTIENLMNPVPTFTQIVQLFAAPIGRIIRFAVRVGLKILEFIFIGVLGPTGARVLAVLKKARSSFIKIIKNPIAFLGNLLAALGQGFSQFSTNIWTHLKAGFFAWLFGALEGAGLTLPKEFNLKGIVSLVLQVLGITWQKMRKKLVKQLGEVRVKKLETTLDIIKGLVTEGPIYIWNKIVEFVGNIKDMVIGAIQNWVVTKIVQSAITKLATMWNPAGAVIQSIITIYNTVQFFIERFNQILALVESIVNSIAKIAAGNIAEAAAWVEKAMARTIPVIISFLARLLGLGGISKTIQNFIKKIQAKVDKAIDKGISWIVKKAQKLIGKGKAVVNKVSGMLFPQKKVKLGKESHTIKVDEKQSKVMIHSTPQPIRQFLLNLKNQNKVAPTKFADVDDAITMEAQLSTLVKATNAKKKKSEDVTADMEQILTLENQLAIKIQSIWNYDDAMETKEKYKLEGLVATYGTTPQAKFDKLTPDHQPQASLIKYVAAQPEFENTFIQQAIKGKHVDGGITINVHEDRHKKGRTYGKVVGDDVKNKIRNDMDAIPETDLPKRKKAAIAVMRSELHKDVSQMNSVISNNKNYDDIKNATSITNSKTVIGMVKKALLGGQKKIKAQNLERYTV